MRFEVHGARAIRDDVVLVVAIGQVNPVGLLGKEVDRRRTEESQIRRTHRRLHRRVVAIEGDDDLDLLPSALTNPRRELHQVSEEEAAREGEVFVQEPVPVKGARTAWQESLGVVQPGGPDGRAGQPREGARARLPRREPHRPADQELEQAQRDCVASAHEKRKSVQPEGRKRHAVRRAEAQPDRAFERPARRELAIAQIAQISRVAEVRELDRPQGHVVRGSVLAGGCLPPAHGARQRRSARHQKAVVQRPLSRVWLELHHGHRRGRAEVVRAQHLEELLGELRKLGVDLELNARRQEGEAFEQTLDVRIRAFERVEPEPPGYLRKVPSELAAEIPQVAKLAIVIVEKPRIHAITPG
jgi:hypothetical protein